MYRMLLKIFVAFIFSVITAIAHAQIILHKATDITQTKALLSANFSDLNNEHGFQYKYGTLPKVDEFSKTALSANSDLVQINTTGDAWSARTVKGWVESKSNLAIGASSIMTTTINFSEPTNITFDWSVDSEEGIGILSFIVDGKKIREISGAVEFTQVSYSVEKGKHILQWQYKKIAISNVGLDIGKVRNINLQNTTEGEWISVKCLSDNERLSNLYPQKSYLFRAFMKENGENIFSSISDFTTIPIKIGDVEVSEISQTSANIDSKIDLGDAEAMINVILGKKKKYHLCSKLEKTLLESNSLKDSTLIDFYFSSGWKATTKGRVYNQETSHKQTITAKFLLSQNSLISFYWNCYGWQGNNLGSKTSSIYLYVDGELVSSMKKKSYDDISKNVSINLSPGSHTLEWVADLAGGSPSWPAWAEVKYLEIENVSEFSEEPCVISNASLPLKKDGLTPNTTYGVYIQSVPTYESDLAKEWVNGNSELTIFTTRNVSASVQSAVNIKQASATIRGIVNGGDATIIATGLQYKDSNIKRWVDYTKVVNTTELSQYINRLKPNTTYNYRSYIQAQDYDTVFSIIENFTTLPVEAQKPIIKKLAQHSVTLEGHVIYGDATIYQRGMQFRKYGVSKWEEVEDGGEEEVYILSKNNLKMNSTYQARTYIQAAGKDVVYSEILEFKTLKNYHKNLYSTSTQTAINLEAELTEVDDNVDVEYGFEYYISCDGFTKNQSENRKTEVHIVKAEIINGKAVATIGSLAPLYKIAYRAYAKIGSQMFYFTSSAKEWDEIWTQKAFIALDKCNRTQTTFTASLDIQKCNDDANITAIEYSIDNTENKNYSPCSKDFKIGGLLPNQKYILNFRGTVNGLLCPLFIKAQEDFANYEFTTKDINVSVKFSAITQTKATMKVSVENGDATISNLCYKINSSDKESLNGTITFKNLTPNTEYGITIYGSINGKEYSWSGFSFTTNPVIVNVNAKTITQTSCDFSLSYNCGDATFVSSGIVYDLSSMLNNDRVGKGTILVKELLPNTTYYYKGYVETKEGGRIYSSLYSFTTKDIVCKTSAATCISNRSATLNGNISCDAYSSAEFGFQWKQMENWNTEPAFTKGYKSDDGSISVSLVNGMLEPNTDYQYRAVVRYNGKYYYSNSWKTFRTESEYIYYPTSVYTMFRTDRENNRLILCGYYVAGSEEIITQGYEYWSNSNSKSLTAMYSNSNVIKIVTDQTMQYELNPETMQDGVYSVRAFVQTASGKVEYGNTLTFEIQQKGVVGIGNQTIDNKHIGCSSNKQYIFISNANGYVCSVYTLNGSLVKKSKVTSDYEEIVLPKGNIYIVKIGSLIFKVSH